MVLMEGECWNHVHSDVVAFRHYCVSIGVDFDGA